MSSRSNRQWFLILLAPEIPGIASHLQHARYEHSIVVVSVYKRLPPTRWALLSATGYFFYSTWNCSLALIGISYSTGLKVLSSSNLPVLIINIAFPPAHLSDCSTAPSSSQQLTVWYLGCRSPGLISEFPSFCHLFAPKRIFSGRTSGYQSQFSSSIPRPETTRFIVLSSGSLSGQLIQPHFSCTILPAWKFANVLTRDF
jgi:hypothetical protein